MLGTTKRPYLICNRSWVCTTVVHPIKANSAFHPSGIGKWVPASAGKAKADMVYSVSGWTRGVQVKLWDPLRTRATPERLRGVFTTRRYIQIHVHLTLPYLTLPYSTGQFWQVSVLPSIDNHHSSDWRYKAFRILTFRWYLCTYWLTNHFRYSYTNDDIRSIIDKILLQFRTARSAHFTFTLTMFTCYSYVIVAK